MINLFIIVCSISLLCLIINCIVYAIDRIFIGGWNDYSENVVLSFKLFILTLIVCAVCFPIMNLCITMAN